MKPLLWDAINPLTGTPFTWDDPNLRWGSPSYYLEPRDPGFVPYETTPNYTDTAPFPATPNKWKYHAIYRVGDHQVGVWSNTVEITVGG